MCWSSSYGFDDFVQNFQWLASVFRGPARWISQVVSILYMWVGCRVDMIFFMMFYGFLRCLFELFLPSLVPTLAGIRVRIRVRIRGLRSGLEVCG